MKLKLYRSLPFFIYFYISGRSLSPSLYNTYYIDFAVSESLDHNFKYNFKIGQIKNSTSNSKKLTNLMFVSKILLKKFVDRFKSYNQLK